ncbi:hypothetical protein [Vibrio mimicus]|uniref:HIT family protein n=1 Tax=Vibrio mimicus TaxID=674 RepID=UPI002FF37013
MTMVIFQNEHFVVSQCRTCNIPGYLILECRAQASSVSELPRNVQMELGVLLGQLELGVIKALNPEQVYWGKFGETGGNLHFHVFPRLNAMTAQYLKCYPTQEELIHGPMLFDWAREHYKVEGGELSIEVLSILSEIKSHLEMT